MAVTDTVLLHREAIETLAALERRACSPGERMAAEWIRDRFESLGCPAVIEEEQAWDGYAVPIASMSALGALAGVAGLRGRRLPAALVAAAIAAGIAEDVSNGPRIFRRAVMRRRTTWNAVAECGDQAADRTLVVIAHHDAAPTGLVFKNDGVEAIAKRHPDIVNRATSGPPFWWPTIAAPLLVALGALTGRRRLTKAGTALGVGSVALLADIARSPVVPGANDNLSGVACLLGLAASLQAEPVPGLRVVLASCGAEEVLQGGIHGFVERHRSRLPAGRTWFVNVDTVGHPQLLLIEGEGPVQMERFDRVFKDLVAGEAAAAGIALRRGMHARASSDSVVPHRAGYPVAFLGSVTAHGTQGDYHVMTDTPEKIDHVALDRVRELVVRVARRLAAT